MLVWFSIKAPKTYITRTFIKTKKNLQSWYSIKIFYDSIIANGKYKINIFSLRLPRSLSLSISYFLLFFLPFGPLSLSLSPSFKALYQSWVGLWHWLSGSRSAWVLIEWVVQQWRSVWGCDEVVHGGDGRGHDVARSGGLWQRWVSFDFGWVLIRFGVDSDSDGVLILIFCYGFLIGWILIGWTLVGFWI